MNRLLHNNKIGKDRFNNFVVTLTTMNHYRATPMDHCFLVITALFFKVYILSRIYTLTGFHLLPPPPPPPPKKKKKKKSWEVNNHMITVSYSIPITTLKILVVGEQSKLTPYSCKLIFRYIHSELITGLDSSTYQYMTCTQSESTYKSVTGPYFWTVSDLLPHGLPTDKKLVLPMPRVYRFLFCYIPVTGWLQVVDFSLCQNSKFHCM